MQCPECGRNFEVDGDGEVIINAVCAFVDCPVEGTTFIGDDIRPLDFNNELARDYEPDFFDRIDEVDEEESS